MSASTHNPSHAVIRFGRPRLVVRHGAAVVASGRAAYWNGSKMVYRRPPAGSPVTHPLTIPKPPAGTIGRIVRVNHGQSPSKFYDSQQVDAAGVNTCGFGANEPSIAQSTGNPAWIVAAAQEYASYDSGGNLQCDDSHAWDNVSHDGGLTWQHYVMPNLLTNPGAFSGDVNVTFDPKDQVFIYAALEVNRNDCTGNIHTWSSSDGINWGNEFYLDAAGSSCASSYSLDKPFIAVDQNPSSPNYGRVVVTWTQFHPSGSEYFDAYTDDGGASWTGSTTSINLVSSSCGNGTAPAFDANGDLMVAWWDCTSGRRLLEELSTDGGHNWTAPADTAITTINDIIDSGPSNGLSDGSQNNCFLNNGGSKFRCDSFPTLAGDPNAADAGGTAFIVVWSDQRSTTQNAQTANVSQLIGLSTVDGGSTWNGGSCCGFDYMAFNDFGDKFYPAASFSPNGRLTVSYSSREQSANSGNANGQSWNMHVTEASSLTSLRANAYVSYTADGTLGNAGSSAFIGDYSGQTTLDQNFDSIPIYTDDRNGANDVRIEDLCYADCYTSLSPDSSVFNNHANGSTFTDFYQVNTDQSFGGSGSDFWNVIAIRNGTDGTGVDNDTRLESSRYYNLTLASSSFSPPLNDYTVINGNSGHAADGIYYPQVHSFSSLGGPYTIQWDAGHVVLSTSRSDGMGGSDVARVYDTYLATGTTYFMGLRPDGGNTSNYSLALHSASAAGGAAEQGRPQAVSDSFTGSVGSPAFVSYNTASDPTQFDGVVVVNNNGGSGTYTLYRDTTAPTPGAFTITNTSGDTSGYTAGSTVQLHLSATNATSGDPVCDMAFSDDGSTFGSFQPYATTTNYNLPAGTGVHTVYVEYRNCAGAVSSITSASITVIHPTVTTLAPTFNGATVTLRASVNIGPSTSGCVFFDYGPTTAYGTTAPVAGHADTSSSTVTLTTALTTGGAGLTPGSIYHVQARAYVVPCGHTDTTTSGGDVRFLSPVSQPSGWGLFTVPTSEDTAQASVLFGDINSATNLNGHAQALAVLQNGNWVDYVPGRTASFALSFGEGVAVLSNSAGFWHPGGTLLGAGGNFGLRPGWNALGPAHGAESEQSICNQIGPSALQVMPLGGSAYTCGGGGGSTIGIAQGVYVQTNAVGTFSQP